MGSDNGDNDERPVHTVTLTRDFYMSKYETTQAQYVAVTANPSRFTGDNNRPVEEVSWFDAIRFANALSASEGLNPCYDNDGNVLGGAGGNPYQCEGYRLPTEAEWEYAARAGTTTDYYFGDDTGQLGDHAWHINNSGSTTHPVGQKQPNAWGLYDMHGNVWEWVYDWYGSSYYSGSPSTNPPGPQAGSTRVGHGGGWDTTAPFQRSANRFTGTPGVRNPYLGFRLVRTGQ